MKLVWIKIADRLIFSMLNQNQITEDDFEQGLHFLHIKENVRKQITKERETREEIIIKIPNKKSEEIAKALDRIERKYKKKFYTKFKTITFDNGSEFKKWEMLEKSCRKKGKRITAYYAHP